MSKDRLLNGSTEHSPRGPHFQAVHVLLFDRTSFVGRSMKYVQKEPRFIQKRLKFPNRCKMTTRRHKPTTKEKKTQQHTQNNKHLCALGPLCHNMFMLISYIKHSYQWKACRHTFSALPHYDHLTLSPFLLELHQLNRNGSAFNSCIIWVAQTTCILWASHTPPPQSNTHTPTHNPQAQYLWQSMSAVSIASFSFYLSTYI